MFIISKMYKLICIGMLAVASITAAFAQTTVSVSPATKNVLPGGTVTLQFVVNNVANLHAASIGFTFNPAVLQATSITVGSFLQPNLLFFATPSLPANPPFNVDQATPGTVPGPGPGALVTVTFNALAVGTTPVTLSTVMLRDGSNTPIPLTIQSGSVTVANPPDTYVNPAYNSGNADGHDFGFDAFNLLAPGVNAVNAGGVVHIAPSTYLETVTLSRNATLSPNSGFPIIQNLVLNTSSVSLGGNINVSGTLTLTSGVLSTGANKVVVTNSAPGAVAITSGSINGEIERAIAGLSNQAYTFTDLYTQLVPNGLQGSLTVSVRSYPNTPPPNVGTGTAVNRYYTVTPNAPLTATLRLAYLDGEINGINEFTMTLFRYTGVAWASAASIPHPAENYVEAPGISQFSNWTIGDVDNPLPIQLASFTGIVSNGGNVALTWITLSEINNYGFYVQRKHPNEQEYFEIPGSFVAGNGTTNEPHTYTFTDAAPGAGSWQYRLKQVDLDNAVHFTEPIQIDIITGVRDNGTPLAFSLGQNYPNPFNPSTTIEFALPKAGYTTLRVFNLLGEEVASLVDGLVDAGRHSISWNASAMPSSVYLYKLTSNGTVETKRLVLMK